MLLLNSWQGKYMEKRLRDAKDVGMKKKQTNEYEYCLEVDPVRKANYCFWVSFCKSRYVFCKYWYLLQKLICIKTVRGYSKI